MAAVILGVGAPCVKIWADQKGGKLTRGPTSIFNTRGKCGNLQWGNSKRIVATRASKNDDQEEEASPSTLLPKEDVEYLWKLGAASLVGSAVIKYGSALFPEITTPNLLLALIIIFTPVVIASLLLFNQSRT